MQSVMLLNPKGGSGKTTIATCLASYLVAHHRSTVLFDHDAQGSSTRWLRVRPRSMPAIHGVAAYQNPGRITRSFQMRVPAGTEHVVVDTPAGIKAVDVQDMIRRADHVIVPVLPSHIDIDAVSAFIDDLLALPPIRNGETRVAVVANRVRARTVIFRELEDFLRRASFPFIARLRESQNYVRASERGVGIHDLPRKQNRVDRQQWAPLLEWLDGRPVQEPPREPVRPRGRESYSLPL